ncbi:hypothetical protein G6F55_014018 [Rhizopus delemar]|nr:hypothetical protein G6F55_014018 [Rhizopus delemar]
MTAAAAPARGQRTGGTDQSEQADGGIAVLIRRLGQQEGERGPKDREHGEAAGTEQGALAKHRFLHEQHADRAQQREVAQAGAVMETRQPALQRQRGHCAAARAGATAATGQGQALRRWWRVRR